MIITRKPMCSRSVLRGIGTTMALPEAMKHDHRGLSVIVAGGSITRNRHVQVAKDKPMTNMLSLMDTLGVHYDSIGDGTGRLSELAA